MGRNEIEFSRWNGVAHYVVGERIEHPLLLRHLASAILDFIANGKFRNGSKLTACWFTACFAAQVFFTWDHTALICPNRAVVGELCNRYISGLMDRYMMPWLVCLTPLWREATSSLARPRAYAI